MMALETNLKERVRTMQLKYQPVSVRETVLDTFYEQSLECDITLPDYCPDIVTILKCEAIPAVLSVQQAGDKLEITGVTAVTVFYLSDSPQIRRYEQKVPFTRQCDLKGERRRVEPVVKVHLNYLNCRALSPRRIDIRGAMSLHAAALGEREERGITEGEGMGLCLRSRPVTATRMTQWVCKQFTFREELELGSGREPIENILHGWCTVTPGESRLAAGKVICKGELQIHLFYQPEGEGLPPACMDYTLPVSQLIDLDGVQEDTVCDLRLRAVAWDLTPKEGEDGTATRISAAVTLEASAKSFVTESCQLADDCYSTQYECQGRWKELQLETVEEIIQREQQFQQTIPLNPGELGQVLDLWVRQDSPCTLKQPLDGGASETCYTAGAAVCAFVLDGEGAVGYLERPLELEIKGFDIAGEAQLQEPELALGQAGYTVTESGLTVRFSMVFWARACFAGKEKLLEEIELEENKPVQRQGRSALTVYFAQPGESVWEIAKHYSTPVTAVREENGIPQEEERLEARRALLIPMM